MKKWNGILLMILLVTVIVGGRSVNAAIGGSTTEEDIVVQPMYTDTQSVTPRLVISDSVVTASTKVIAKTKCDISITMKLQKKSGDYWLTIKTWTTSAEDVLNLSISKNYTVPSGDYRVYATVKSGADTINKTSATVTK